MKKQLFLLTVYFFVGGLIFHVLFRVDTNQWESNFNLKNGAFKIVFSLI